MWNILASSLDTKYIELVMIAKMYQPQFRYCRYGYETRVVYDYLEKGKESYSRWKIASIRISLFFDKLLTFIIVLLIPDKEYGFEDKIKLMRGMKLEEQE